MRGEDMKKKGGLRSMDWIDEIIEITHQTRWEVWQQFKEGGKKGAGR